MNEAPNPIWNSLEIAKLLASVATPLAVVTAGYLIQSELSAASTIVGLRAKTYEALGPELNKIYCFIEDRCDFLDHTPDTIIQAKRTADRVMFAHRAIWPADTFQAYESYMDTAFCEGSGARGEPAPIRAEVGEKDESPLWNETWSDRLVGKTDDHSPTYWELVDLIGRDLVEVGSPRSSEPENSEGEDAC